jgi:uncharacterized protein (TIGR03083 family)
MFSGTSTSTMGAMETTVTEIADGIYRLSAYCPTWPRCSHSPTPTSAGSPPALSHKGRCTMTMAVASARDIRRTSPDLAATVTGAELDAFLAAARNLDDGDWAKPTDCPEWTVKDLVAHVVGHCEEAVKLRVLLRRRRVGHRRYPNRSRLDAMNRQQVDDLGRRSPAELTEMLARLGPRVVRANRRVPSPLRRLNITRLFPEDPLPDPTLGYVLDVIAARDPWMHRVDLSTATGKPMVHGDHEREIVAQVVRDLGLAWAGPAVVLELTGPVGGQWTLGTGEPVATVRADAVGYLRTLSGRDDEPALDVDGDSSAANALASARVPF